MRTPENIIAIGLTLFWPLYFGALPWVDAAILATLRVITHQLGEQQADLFSARVALARIDFAIQAEQQTLGRLDHDRRLRRAIIDARARAMYIAGPLGGGQAFTKGGTLDDYVAKAASLEFVASYDQQMLEDLARIHDQAVKARLALQSDRAEAVQRRDEVAQRVSFVADLADAQQTAHDHLSSTINAYRSELAALQREQARIIGIINQYGSRGTISGVPGRMGFAWPTSSHRINSPYGPRWGGFHTGIDIWCPEGTRFAAAKSGVVIAAEWGGGYGNMTIVDHGGGYSSLYAHQSHIGVHKGQHVRRGQIIGRCGSTGNSTGAHLHFEIRINGQYVNPRPYLP